MSTKCSQLFLPQLVNRSSLNPSCFKEKQRPEWDFPGAKVAGIPKSPIRVSVKNPKKPPPSPCRTTRTLRERDAFPHKSGSVFLSAAVSPTCRSQGSPRRKPAVSFKGFASPFGARSVLFGTTRHNEFTRIKILLKKANALVREHPRLPCVKGAGSRVTRKCETDEGLASPYGRGAPQGRRGRIYPLSHFVTAPPEWEPRGTRGTDCHTSDIGHWFAMTWFFRSTLRRKNRVPKNRDAAEICAIQAISP